LLFWAKAAEAVKLKIAKPSTAKELRNLSGNGIFPPVLMDFVRPIAGFICDWIGTLIRREPRAKLGLIGPVLSSATANCA
jgi:hypothetical protein